MTDLQRWLATATAGLPAEVAILTREELAAHYEDALDDYLDQGMTRADAHTRVMTDLGAAAHTAQGLSDVHRGQRHYVFAAIASLLAFCIIFVLPAGLYAAGVGERSLPMLALYVARPALMIYTMFIQKWLIGWRFHLPQVAHPINLLIIGLVLESIGMIVSVFIAGSADYADISRSLMQSQTLFQAGLLVVTQAGRMAASIGALWLGYLLARTDGWLYGLRLPLAVLTMAMGAGIGLACIVPYFSSAGSVWVMAMVLIAHVLVWPLLTLLFFRAAYRSPVHPQRVA